MNPLHRENYENVPPADGKQSVGKRQSMISLSNNHLNLSDNDCISVDELVAFAPFIIKVRVTSKGEIRSFNKDGKPNQVFSADLIDKEGSEITATFFGEAAQMFHPLIQENSVYIMKNGSVRVSSSKFNKKNTNGYQIIFEKQDASAITKVDDDTNIKANKFNFVKIKDLQQLQAESIVDIAGYIKDVWPIQQVKLKDGTDTRDKRSFSVFDNSNSFVEMTLWGDLAKELNLKKDQLIVVKGARVVEFLESKALSSTFGTKIILDAAQMPDDVVLQHLDQWKSQEFNGEAQLSSISAEPTSRKFIPWSIEEINKQINNGVFSQNGTMSFDLTAYVSHIKTESTNLFYPSCQKCSKKVTKTDDNTYKCDACNKTTDKPAYRYTLSIRLLDQTGSMWVSAFDKVAAAVVDMEAVDMKMLRDTNEAASTERFKEAFNKEHNFKVMAKKESYQGEEKIKFQITRVEKISYAKHGMDIHNLLEQYAGMTKL